MKTPEASPSKVQEVRGDVCRRDRYSQHHQFYQTTQSCVQGAFDPKPTQNPWVC